MKLKQGHHTPFVTKMQHKCHKIVTYFKYNLISIRYLVLLGDFRHSTDIAVAINLDNFDFITHFFQGFFTIQPWG